MEFCIHIIRSWFKLHNDTAWSRGMKKMMLSVVYINNNNKNIIINSNDNEGIAAIFLEKK